MDRLTELNAFLAVIDTGGFAAAARSLGRSPPTVTRIVAEFEGRLGVRLFDRSSRRCVPTDAGRRLAEDARHLVGDYDELIANAAGQARSPRGMLRVTAPYFFGREHVSQSILAFLDTHPGISCELDLSDRTADLVEDAFDLAVRIGTVSDPNLRARRVGWVSQVIVCSPAYLEACGRPAAPSSLVDHQMIQHGASSSRPWHFRNASGESLTIAARSRFTVNQADAALAAARAGRGLVMALSYQVEEDLRRGALVRVLDEFEPEPLAVRLIWPEGRDRLLRLRLLIDHLAGHLTSLKVINPPIP